MIAKGTENLPLADLVQMRTEIDELIKERREEAANEARKSLERTAEELGISVRELVNGTGAKRARKTSPAETDGDE